MFKVGDRVEVLPGGERLNDKFYSPGAQGIIVNIVDNTDCLVKFDTGSYTTNLFSSKWYAHTSRLSLVTK